MRHFDDPAARFEALVLCGLDLFAAWTHMRRVAMRADDGIGLCANIARIGTKIFHHGFGLWTILLSSTAWSWLTSWRLAPTSTSPKATPFSSTSRCRPLPFFSPVCGVSTNRIIAHRSFELGSVNRLPSPLVAALVVIKFDPAFPQRFEHSSHFPFLKI